MEKEAASPNWGRQRGTVHSSRRDAGDRLVNDDQNGAPLGVLVFT